MVGKWVEVVSQLHGKKIKMSTNGLPCASPIGQPDWNPRDPPVAVGGNR